jgi:hypothetical protein
MLRAGASGTEASIVTEVKIHETQVPCGSARFIIGTEVEENGKARLLKMHEGL